CSGGHFPGGRPGGGVHAGGIDRPRHSFHLDSFTLCHQQPPGGQRPLVGGAGGRPGDSGAGVHGGSSVGGDLGSHEGFPETPFHGGQGEKTRPAEGGGGVGG